MEQGHGGPKTFLGKEGTTWWPMPSWTPDQAVLVTVYAPATVHLQAGRLLLPSPVLTHKPISFLSV